MDGYTRQAPFEICIVSNAYPQHMANKDLAQGARRRHQKAWLTAAALVGLMVIVAWQLMGPGLDTILIAQNTRNEQEQSQNLSSPGGMDFGMVLLDIKTRQEALAYHVPREGVYVLSVTKGSEADQAGLMPGDCISRIGDTAVTSTDQLMTTLNLLQDGERAELTVLRGEESRVVDLAVRSQARQT